MHAGAQGEFLAAVEEGEIEGNTGAEGCFAEPEEEAEDEHGCEGGGKGLQRGQETPGEDAEGDVDMGRQIVVAARVRAFENSLEDRCLQ